MSTTNLKFNHPQYSDDILNKSISEILISNTLLSMASIRKTDKSFESWICTVFYAFNSNIDIYILTSPDSQHIMNLKHNKSVAIAIFDSRQEPTKPKRGLQIFGECQIAKGLRLLDAYKSYGDRFIWLPDIIKKPDDFAKGIIQSKIFIIRPKLLKIFDEQTFGEEVWITVSVNK